MSATSNRERDTWLIPSRSERFPTVKTTHHCRATFTLSWGCCYKSVLWLNLLQNTLLLVEARAARSYRDELDALRERAIKADKLESEVGRYREQLHKMEFYKAKVEVNSDWLMLNQVMLIHVFRSFMLRTQLSLNMSGAWFLYVCISGAKGGQQDATGDQRGVGGSAGRLESTLR